MYQNNTPVYDNIKKAANRGVLAGMGGLAMLVATACGQQDATVKNQGQYTPPAQIIPNENQNAPKTDSTEGTFKTFEGYINGQQVTKFTEGILLKNSNKPRTNVLIPRKEITRVLNPYGNVVQYLADKENTYNSKVENLLEGAFARLQRIDVFGHDGRRIASYDLRVDWTSNNPRPDFRYQGNSGIFDQNNAPNSVRQDLDELVNQFRAIRPQLEMDLGTPQLGPNEIPSTPSQKPPMNSPQQGRQKLIV